MNLNQRSEVQEIMDDLHISGQVIDQTLRELNIINERLGGNAISISSLKKIMRQFPVRSVVDLGCGGADILISMAKLAAKNKQQVAFTGIDANPHIVEYARKNTHKWPNIHVRCEDIFSATFQQREYDVIHCCLFLHHFTEEQLVRLFQSFAHQAHVAIIVNDLHRHFLAYHSIKWLTRFFSKSYMVRNDASLSVARGFKRSEITTILQKAGISNYTLKWKWAFRWQLVILR